MNLHLALNPPQMKCIRLTPWWWNSHTLPQISVSKFFKRCYATRGHVVALAECRLRQQVFKHSTNSVWLLLLFSISADSFLRSWEMYTGIFISTWRNPRFPLSCAVLLTALWRSLLQSIHFNLPYVFWKVFRLFAFLCSVCKTMQPLLHSMPQNPSLKSLKQLVDWMAFQGFHCKFRSIYRMKQLPFFF